MQPEQSFTTQSYLPEDGRSFLDYMQVVMKSMDRLRSDGRIPDDPGRRRPERTDPVTRVIDALYAGTLA
ncbi:MAG TPA: hypothetical protein VHV76_09165 [Mycobacteriales bacterium]|jgi:hypothetical protein|nr:hypothetical protein [Mycobacteriales bacterium]